MSAGLAGEAVQADALRLGRKIRALLDVYIAHQGATGAPDDARGRAMRRGTAALHLIMAAQMIDDDRHTPWFVGGLGSGLGSFFAQCSPENQTMVAAALQDGLDEGVRDWNVATRPVGNA